MKDTQFDTAAQLPVRPLRKSDERVRVFQRKLYLKAKQEPGFKAYSLYDKVCSDEVLQEAYTRVRSGQNLRSGTGVDGVTFEQIEKEGVNSFIKDLQTAFDRGPIVHKRFGVCSFPRPTVKNFVSWASPPLVIG